MTTTAEQAVVVCIHTNTTIATPVLLYSPLVTGDDVSICVEWRVTGYKTRSARAVDGISGSPIWRTGSGCCHSPGNLSSDHRSRLLRYYLRCSCLRSRSRFPETTPISGPAIAGSVLWGWVCDLGTSPGSARSLGGGVTSPGVTPSAVLCWARSPEVQQIKQKVSRFYGNRH